MPLAAFDRMQYLDDEVQGLSKIAFFTLAVGRVLDRPLFAGLPILAFSDRPAASRFRVGNLALGDRLMSEGHVLHRIKDGPDPDADMHGNLWDMASASVATMVKVFGSDTKTRITAADIEVLDLDNATRVALKQLGMRLVSDLQRVEKVRLQRHASQLPLNIRLGRRRLNRINDELVRLIGRGLRKRP